MSIVPAGSLSRRELKLLGNNLLPLGRKLHREVDAVNRSLAAHGEAIDRLHRLPSSSNYTSAALREEAVHA